VGVTTAPTVPHPEQQNPPIDPNTYFANIVGELRNRYGDLSNDEVRLLLYQLQRMGISPQSSLTDIDRMMKALAPYANAFHTLDQYRQAINNQTGLDVEKLRQLMGRGMTIGPIADVGGIPAGGFIGGLPAGGLSGFATGTSPDTRLDNMKRLRIIKYLRAHGVDLFPGYATGTQATNPILDRVRQLLGSRRPLR